MENKWQMEWRSFDGTIAKGKDQVRLSFSVAVDDAGEAAIILERFLLDTTSEFIVKHFHNGGTDFERFTLHGRAPDGAEFHCDDAFFTSLANSYLEDGESICPVVHYSLAKIVMPFAHSEVPVLTFRIKGFESSRPLRAETHLGRLEMVGGKDIDEKNEVSGFVRVTAFGSPNNLETWKESAEELCDHVRHVMSFAANVDLMSPLTELADQDRLTLELYSCSRQQKSIWAPFDPLDLREIFQCAVRSYFEPTFAVKNLFFAIKWFNMHGLYREANLISSMTVLENLIDSNLLKEDGLLLGEKAFEKLRKKLSAVVKDEVKVWSTDADEQRKLVAEINTKFSDLRRRSLLEKLNILATRWGVPLHDIEKSRISEAKSARDQVVHRGHYEPSAKVVGDLHDHLLTVRELVVRFILTALGFQGRYRSFVNGQHYRNFASDVAVPEYCLTYSP